MTETNLEQNLSSRIRSTIIRSSNSSSCQTPSFRSKRIKKTSNDLLILTNEKETRAMSPKCTYTDTKGQKRRIIFVLSEKQVEPVRPILKFSEIVRSIAERYKMAPRLIKNECRSGNNIEEAKHESLAEYSPSSLEINNFKQIEDNKDNLNIMIGNMREV